MKAYGKLKGGKGVFSDQYGFTLVEVVVAIIVLSLVTVAVVQIYNSNLLGIILSGNRTEAIYDVQQQLETTLATKDTADLEEEPDEFITFKFGDDEIGPIQGVLVTKTSTSDGTRPVPVSATVFIPDDPEGEESE